MPITGSSDAKSGTTIDKHTSMDEVKGPGEIVSILEKIGAPVDKNNIDNLITWADAENTGNENWYWNLFSSTQPEPGSVGGGEQGDIQRYPNEKEGVEGTAATLEAYPALIKALKSDAPYSEFTQAEAEPGINGGYWGDENWPATPDTELSAGLEGGATEPGGGQATGPIGPYKAVGPKNDPHTISRENTIAGQETIGKILSTLDLVMNPARLNNDTNVITDVLGLTGVSDILSELETLPILIFGRGVFVLIFASMFWVGLNQLSQDIPSKVLKGITKPAQAGLNIRRGGQRLAVSRQRANTYEQQQQRLGSQAQQTFAINTQKQGTLSRAEKRRGYDAATAELRVHQRQLLDQIKKTQRMRNSPEKIARLSELRSRLDQVNTQLKELYDQYFNFATQSG